jgi:hypothetical protein
VKPTLSSTGAKYPIGERQAGRMDIPRVTGMWRDLLGVVGIGYLDLNRFFLWFAGCLDFLFE